MKTSPLTAVLLGIVAVSVIVSLVLCAFLYIPKAREIRNLNAQSAMIQNQRLIVNSLVNDLLEYSKTHKDIEPILRAANVLPTQAAASGATNAPSGR
jgi:hypothetical protein